jgi:hypothetical protein
MCIAPWFQISVAFAAAAALSFAPAMSTPAFLQWCFVENSPVFMRVRGNVPHFTFGFSSPNVNG